MKVSIITVCRNSAHTILETLRSVEEQAYPEIEHIVVDGASTDGTLEIVNRHGRRLARVISEPDAGIYDGMNKGIAAATGELVGFLNADDVLADSSVISAIVETAKASGKDAVYGDLVYVRQDDGQAEVRRWRAGEYSRLQLYLGWMPPHPTLYVRRSLLETAGGFDTSYRISADYDLVLRLFFGRNVTAAVVPRTLVRMRVGGASNGSVSALWQKSCEDLRALRASGVGGLISLACKNLRKAPQFVFRQPVRPVAGK